MQILKQVDEFNQFLSQRLVAKNDIPVNSDVFLIDHAWTTRITDMRKGLVENPRLLYRMKGIVRSMGEKFDLPGHEEEVEAWEGMYDLDNQEVSEVTELPEGKDCLSMTGAPIDSLNGVIQVLPLIKALWVDETPLCSDEFAEKELLFQLEENFENVEMLNSKFTRHAREWALAFASRKTNLEEIVELDLSGRNIERADPEILRLVPNVSSLDLTSNIITTAWLQVIAQLPNIKRLLVDANEESKVWDVISTLSLKYLNSWDVEKGRPDVPDAIISQIWKYAGTYRLITEDKYDETSIWYIMDEVGSSILHSDEPNVRVAPFLYQPPEGDQIAFSIMWPVKDIAQGQIIYRDMLQSITEEEYRSTRLYPWFNVPKSYFKSQLQLWQSSIGAGFFNEQPPPQDSEVPEAPLKLWTDVTLFRDTLHDERFVKVEDLREADIIWSHQQIIMEGKWQLEVAENQFINEFPFEGCMVYKNKLAHTIQKQLGIVPWFPMTFELNKEVPAFVGEFLRREVAGEDNHWIVKPTNMARGIDHYITNNLDSILRYMETAPKICQKYIERPLTLSGSKFDLRYIVLLRNTSPLELYVYDKFWVRSANRPFSLSYAEDSEYETHFTVMNYSAHKLQTIMYYELIERFEQEYQRPWAPVQQAIYSMFTEIFTAAAKGYPEMFNRKSRAMYGIDVMVNADFTPQLLEINFCPDCKRATVQFPPFTDDIFGCLFFGDTNNVIRL